MNKFKKTGLVAALEFASEHKNPMPENRGLRIKMDKFDIIFITISLVSIGGTLLIFYMIAH